MEWLKSCLVARGFWVKPASRKEHIRVVEVARIAGDGPWVDGDFGLVSNSDRLAITVRLRQFYCHLGIDRLTPLGTYTPLTYAPGDRRGGPNGTGG